MAGYLVISESPPYCPKLYTVLAFLLWYENFFPERCGKEAPFRP